MVKNGSSYGFHGEFRNLHLTGEKVVVFFGNIVVFVAKVQHVFCKSNVSFQLCFIFTSIWGNDPI